MSSLELSPTMDPKVREVLLLPFCKCGNQDTEGLNNFPKVPELVSSRAKQSLAGHAPPTQRAQPTAPGQQLGREVGSRQVQARPACPSCFSPRVIFTLALWVGRGVSGGGGAAPGWCCSSAGLCCPLVAPIAGLAGNQEVWRD